MDAEDGATDDTHTVVLALATDRRRQRLHNPIAQSLQPQLDTAQFTAPAFAEVRFVPLPHYTSPGPVWQTSSTTLQRETRHDQQAAIGQPAFRTTTISDQVPRIRPTWISPPSTRSDERTNDGLQWRSHREHDTGQDRTPSQQSTRQHMAYPLSRLASFS